jgi:hypothetical protein
MFCMIKSLFSCDVKEESSGFHSTVNVIYNVPKFHSRTNNLSASPFWQLLELSIYVRTLFQRTWNVYLILLCMDIYDVLKLWLNIHVHIHFTCSYLISSIYELTQYIHQAMSHKKRLWTRLKHVLTIATS